ncbi:MAG: right-handed parallel beta-helix repeat-containing protein [Candidatus Krumholzibacteriia bacterium]
MRGTLFLLGVALALLWDLPAGATEYYYVPSEDVPTLHDAVAAAGAGAAPEQVIFIRESPLFVTSPLLLGGAFHCGRRLTIRPDPGVPTLRRATIASVDGSQQIFTLSFTSCITLQDLDIVRATTNANDLVFLDHASNIRIHRCRIGSVWSSPGGPGWSNLRVYYPTNVVVRNCILFSLAPGNFDTGILATDFNDPVNSLLLYNNVVSDYRIHGIDVTGSPFVGPLVLLRNNVVVNHQVLAPEPVAFRSDVNDNMTVVTSHNAAFASPGFVESLIGVQRISGVGTGTFVVLGRPSVDPAFVEHVWAIDPPWDSNSDFYRLVDGGPLHDDALDLGVNVDDGAPHANDVAVHDDIERDPRPGGFGLHTDRGADQVEPGVASSAPSAPGANGVLWAAPRRNPTRGSAGVLFRSEQAGRLSFEVFDVAGHRLHHAERAVTAGHTGVLEWPRVTHSGQFFYRLSLTPKHGNRVEVRGRLVLVR